MPTAVIALLQRVTTASVVVSGATVAAIGPGLLALTCVERGDGEKEAKRLAERVCGYRIFSDDTGRMNLSVVEVGGSLLLVPQFTLAADTKKGMRPGFSSSGNPVAGETLFRSFVAHCRERVSEVQTGQFGSHMEVSLTNDGPVTFWLQVEAADASRRRRGSARVET